MSHVLSVREGDLIGEYRLVRLLGADGMGAVFEAVHETIGKRAAIKFLSLDAKRHPEFERRFIDEARAASEIQHAGVVNIFGVGRHTDGTMWMLMELLPGETLYSRLLAMQQSPARRMDRSVALTIARQLASVLVATHARGIVHRDQNLYSVKGWQWMLMHELLHAFCEPDHAPQNGRAEHFSGPIMCAWSSDCVNPQQLHYQPEDLALLCKYIRGGPCPA